MFFDSFDSISAGANVAQASVPVPDGNNKKKGKKRKSTSSDRPVRPVQSVRRGRSSGPVKSGSSHKITSAELSLSWTYSYSGEKKSLFYSHVGTRAGGDNYIYAVSLKRAGDDLSAERPLKHARVWNGRNPLDNDKLILDKD